MPYIGKTNTTFTTFTTSDANITDDLTVTDDASVGGNLTVTGTTTFNSASTITVDGNTDALTVISTDADANVGPVIRFDRASSSPADGDSLGKINFIGHNDAGEDIDYANIGAVIVDASDGTEDGRLDINVLLNGTEKSRIKLINTETVFNETSDDIDFRVEGNGDANLLFVDASTDRVGIGKSGPSELLDVDGTLNTTNFKVGGAQGSDGQVLTSTGSGVGWEDAGGGAMTLIGTATVSNNTTNSFSLTSCFSTTYDNYLIVGHDVGKSTNGNSYVSDDIFMYIIDENGINQDNGTYSFATQTTNGSAFSASQGVVRWCTFSIHTRHLDRTNFFKMDIALHNASGQDKVTAVGRYMKSWKEPFIFNGAVLAVNTATSNAYTATPSGLHFKLQTADSYFVDGMTLRIYGYNKS